MQSIKSPTRVDSCTTRMYRWTLDGAQCERCFLWRWTCYSEGRTYLERLGERRAWWKILSGSMSRRRHTTILTREDVERCCLILGNEFCIGNFLCEHGIQLYLCVVKQTRSTSTTVILPRDTSRVRHASRSPLLQLGTQFRDCRASALRSFTRFNIEGKCTSRL